MSDDTFDIEIGGEQPDRHTVSVDDGPRLAVVEMRATGVADDTDIEWFLDGATLPFKRGKTATIVADDNWVYGGMDDYLRMDELDGNEAVIGAVKIDVPGDPATTVTLAFE